MFKDVYLETITENHIMFRLPIFYIFIISALSLQVQAQNTKSFQKKMKFWMGWYHIPGAQIVVLKDGEIAQTFNFGTTEYRGDIDVSNKTRFQIGKVNQVFTSLALMRELSEGRVNNHMALNKQLTTYKLRNSVLNKYKKTTPAQLLNHSGGINRPSFEPLDKDIELTTLDLLQGSDITGKKKIHNFQTPLKSYLYSEGAFVLARRLVEEQSDLDYKSYLNTYITKPLDVTFEFNGYALSENLLAGAHEYSKWAYDTPYKFPNPSGYGCWMSAKEYGKLVLRVFEDKDLAKKLSIKPEYFEAFTTPSIKIKESSYSSCAVFEKHDYEKGIYRLTDTRHGYRSFMYYDTDSKEGFIVLMNSEYDYMFRKRKGKVLKKIKKFMTKYHLLNTLPTIESL